MKAAAHPRSRGENGLDDVLQVRVRGSSPLTRGKRTETWGWHPETRLIPAHAGKTGAAWLACVACAAHPRSRGENLNAVAGGNADTGSSPLTRGKRHLVAVGEAIRRLIPAHAGKTAANSSHRLPRQAHPRSRGEN